jgi:hypothetical protein
MYPSSAAHPARSTPGHFILNRAQEVLKAGAQPGRKRHGKADQEHSNKRQGKTRRNETRTQERTAWPDRANRRINAGGPEPALSDFGRSESMIPANIESLIEAPNLAGEMDTQKGIVHDMAHIVVGNERGIIFNDGIRSHLHPDTKGIMEAPIDWTPFLDVNGDFDPHKFKTKIADLAATYVAGGVANDLYHDIPFTKNHHVGADLRILKGYMRQLDFTDEEASMMIAQALLDAAKILLSPGVQDVLEKHASVREAGLDPRYHVSPQRMEQILQDLKCVKTVKMGWNEACPCGSGKEYKKCHIDGLLPRPESVRTECVTVRSPRKKNETIFEV